MAETKKVPLPGYGLAIIDGSQYANVDFQGEDKFDTPQTGKLIFLRDEDKKKTVREGASLTFGELLDKKIYWAKYADQDATFHDDNLSQDVVFIKLEKIVGFEHAA
jgi:hypothetical protein